jgi:hypothetical protein
MVGVDPTLFDTGPFGISWQGLPAISADAQDKFGAVTQAGLTAQGAVAQISDPQYAAVVSAVSQLAAAVGNGTSITDVQTAVTGLQSAVSGLAGQSGELAGSFIDDLGAAVGAIGQAVHSWVNAGEAVLNIHDSASAGIAADAVLTALGDTRDAFEATGQVVKDTVPGPPGDFIQDIADVIGAVGDFFNQVKNAIENPTPPDDRDGHPGSDDDHPVNPGGVSSDDDNDGDLDGAPQHTGSLTQTGVLTVLGTGDHPTSGGEDIIGKSGVEAPVSVEAAQAGNRQAG